jgi:tRNA 2-thiouridine synthesizing protein A
MSEPTRQIILDARQMMPPEPMERTLEALGELAPDGELILLLYREPMPLYKILRNNGYTHRTTLREDGTFEIAIRPAASGAPGG